MEDIVNSFLNYLMGKQFQINIIFTDLGNILLKFQITVEALHKLQTCLLHKFKS